MGGWVLSIRPCAPRAIRPASVGSSLRHRSNTSAGAAESRPMISSFEKTMPRQRRALYRECGGAANAGVTPDGSLGRHARDQTARALQVAADLGAVDQHG